jgi:hypothetical protein
MAPEQNSKEELLDEPSTALTLSSNLRSQLDGRPVIDVRCHPPDNPPHGLLNSLLSWISIYIDYNLSDCTRDTLKYTSSSNDDSDDELDYNDHFKGLGRFEADKINELIDALNDKDRLLKKQEDILYEELKNLLLWKLRKIKYFLLNCLLTMILLLALKV